MDKIYEVIWRKILDNNKLDFILIDGVVTCEEWNA